MGDVTIHLQLTALDDDDDIDLARWIHNNILNNEYQAYSVATVQEQYTRRPDGLVAQP